MPRRNLLSGPTSDNWRVTIRRRLFFAAALFVLWATGIQARLVYLQVHRHADLEARAENQSARTIPVSAKRGDILDRHGRVLAYSVESESVYAVPPDIDDPAKAAAALCGALGDCSPKDREALVTRLRQKRAFAYVRRQVSPEQAKRIANLKLNGVDFMKEDRRFYPKRELAAQVLGFVGVENKGLAGLESAYDSQISGTQGKMLYERDARGHRFSRLERPPTAGATVELTIDEYLQHIAERELRDAVSRNRASAGTVVVMDPHTGEILALANEPTFNPNVFADSEPEQRRNRAVQDLYEPGSTFKVVTASAALEEHLFGVDQMIDASGGRIKIGSRVIPDTHDYGVLSFTDVIVKSSNVGAIRIGLQLGAERLGLYARRFGFGRALSPDFPSETAGILWDPARLDTSALASMSMGYQVGVTPLQMVAAVSSVANGGQLIQPRVVRALIREGKRHEVKPTVLGRTIDAETSATLTGIMEQVVERGTATYAQIDGYTIAGKTGTAHKLVNGRYSNTDYFASFVGFLPSKDPVVAIIVVLDSPHAVGHFGGPIAGPVFQRIGQAALRHFGVAPTLNAPSPVLVARRGMPSDDRPTNIVREATIVPVGAPGSVQVLPDFRGLSAREVVRTLTKMGLSVRLHGSGVVSAQAPPAGTSIDSGRTCDLWLERAPVAVASLAPEQ
ncbi:MAG: transpeptidase family protein [Vicinamibacterales bacterium]|nr:transpeptidase family protein [Vicinamibacterales bacterium]